MKKIIFTMYLGLLMLGCKKEKVMENTVISAAMDVSFVNCSGENLLNPKTGNYLTANDIETFVIRGGVKTRVFYPNLESPKMFWIGTDGTGGPYILTLYFDLDKDSFQDNKVVMFLKYKDGGEDKFTAEFNSDRSDNYKVAKKIWHNDVQIWETKDATIPHVTIKKGSCAN
ncbi:hypothetical protein [Pedobacter sp.]